MTSSFTRVVDRKIAPCLLVAFVLPIAMQVSARAGEPCLQGQKLIPADGFESQNYGYAVDTDGDVGIIGTERCCADGSAYILRFDGSSWIDEQKIEPSNPKGGSFGASVAIRGDIAIVGASGEDEPSNDSGAAYVYRFDGANWNEESRLSDTGGSSEVMFGAAVAVSPDHAVVTATGSPAVYFFRYDGQDWVLEDARGGPDGINFGASVALDNDWVAVGAPADGGNGAVHFYRFDGEHWNIEVIVQALDGNEGDEFGAAVALDGDRLVVGAHADDDNGMYAGSAYIFDFDGLGWVERAKINSPSDGLNENFGRSVAVEGDILIVGAPDDDIGSSNSGAAYVYRFEDEQWINTEILVASDSEQGDSFGWSLSISDARALVGAKSEDAVAPGAGAVYAFFVGAPDCNNNGSPDSCDINSGVSQDCNGNNLPDECEFIHFFSADSNQMLPIGDGFPQSFVVPSPPPAAASVTLTIAAVGDFSSTSEWLDVDVNGTYVGTVVGGIFDDCAMLPLVGNILVDADAFNALVEDSDAAIGITASSQVDPFLCETSYVVVSVAYQPIDRDCNANGIPDECDIDSGSSADCNSDGLPDECELMPRFIAASDQLSPIGAESPQSFIAEGAPIATSDVLFSLEAVADLGASFEWIDIDVNGSFVGSVFVETADDDCPALPSVDGLIVALETFNDAVAGGDAIIDLIPTAEVDADLCIESFISVVLEYDIGPLSPDCNANGVLDECETDCNSNTIPDDCDVDGGTSPDCNENGVPDECDVESGSSDDCDSDGTPDECQLDCNENGVADPCDIAGGTSQDCASNGIPDECETDCNDNGTPDECDIAGGSSLDCNVNSIPDDCEDDICPGDVNDDCLIDPLDSGFILARFGCVYPGDGESCLAADVNGDGLVDPLDVGFVLARFGLCP